MMCCLHCYTLLFFSEENLDFIDPESRSNEAETKLIETKTESTSPKTDFLEKDLKETETEARVDIKSIMALYEKNLKKASESVLKNSEDLSKFLPFLEVTLWKKLYT